MGSAICTATGRESAFASCTNCSTVDAADWIFCLDAHEVANPKASGNGDRKKRRAKDSYADQSREVDLKRLEDLTLELFKAHDLNDDGMLEEMELVKLNERIAMLHHGKGQAEIQEVRDTYHKLFRTKLDPEGRPVPYEIFRKYARGVLEELDKDPEAQEMILEQFVAEARAGRDAMDVASLMPEDSPPLEARLAEIPSARETSGGLQSQSVTRGESSNSATDASDAPLIPGSGHYSIPDTPRRDEAATREASDASWEETVTASKVLRAGAFSDGRREISGPPAAPLPDGI